MEDILYDWKKLSLTEDEDVKVSLSKSKNQRRKDYVLVAKFVTKRALNVEAIGQTFKPLWKAKKDFKVCEAGDHILLFVFELETYAKQVLANEPWTFDKHAVLQQRFDDSIPSTYLRFTILKFLVQIYGLPMHMLDPDTTIEIGETLGQVTLCENPIELVGGDVSKPLYRGPKIALDDNEEIWVSFKYEKLPNFCYWCGLISHDGKDCEVWLVRKDSANTKHHQYGPWLRATPFNPGKTPFIVVTGMGNGLGGTTKSSKPSTVEKPYEMAVRPNRNTNSRPDYNENGGADQTQATDMETSDLGKHITSNLQKNSNPIIKVIDSNPNLYSF